MTLRRRTYLSEKREKRKGPVRKIEIPGISYQIIDGKWLKFIHVPSGKDIVRFVTQPIKAPTKAVKDVVAMLKSKHKGYDWNVPLDKLNLRKAFEITNDMREVVKKHEVHNIYFRKGK